MDNSTTIAQLFLRAAKSLQIDEVVADDRSQQKARIDSAIQAFTAAQGDIADARIKLIRASRSMDAIEPILKKKSGDQVDSIQSFRFFYKELSEKLNELVGSLTKVNQELMDMSSQAAEPVTPESFKEGK